MSIPLPNVRNDALPLGLRGAVYLENFKCFGPCGQTIPLSPITLLFGPNSCGKSSVFQAIHLAFQSYFGQGYFVTGTVDSAKLRYSTTVHKGRTNEQMVIGLTLKPVSHSITARECPTIYFRFSQGPDDTIILDRLDFAVGLGCTVSLKKDDADLLVVGFRANTAEISSFIQQHAGAFKSEVTEADVTAIKSQLVGRRISAAPPSSAILATPPNGAQPLREVLSNLVNDGIARGVIALSHFQRNLAHLHPLRDIPSRKEFARIACKPGDFVTDIEHSVWKRLLTNEGFLSEVNQWLGKGALQLGYELVAKDVPSTVDEKQDANRILVVRDTENVLMETLDLDLTSVGVGISQVIPVVGTCCTHDDVLFLIEQPELHLHPRSQCELADVFIAKSKDAMYVAGRYNGQNTFLLETHSEHLILRMLRRIRETTEGVLEEHKHLKLAPEDVSVNYLEPTPMGVAVHDMAVTHDGDFVSRWPAGFFPERGKELFG